MLSLLLLLFLYIFMCNLHYTENVGSLWIILKGFYLYEKSPEITFKMIWHYTNKTDLTWLDFGMNNTGSFNPSVTGHCVKLGITCKTVLIKGKLHPMAYFDRDIIHLELLSHTHAHTTFKRFTFLWRSKVCVFEWAGFLVSISVISIQLK